MQDKAALAITVTMQGTSRYKICQELGLESPNRRLSCMFMITKKAVPDYLINLIPKCEQYIRTMSNHALPTYT